MYFKYLGVLNPKMILVIENIRCQCIRHFAWTFVNEKAVFKAGAVFAHSQSKTTTHWQFRMLFATVSMQQKGVFYINKWQWMKHRSITSPRSQISSQLRTAAGENCPKQPKTQTSAGNDLTFVFWDVQGILFIDYLEKGRTINSEYYIALVVHKKE